MTRKLLPRPVGAGGPDDNYRNVGYIAPQAYLVDQLDNDIRNARDAAGRRYYVRRSCKVSGAHVDPYTRSIQIDVDAGMGRPGLRRSPTGSPTSEIHGSSWAPTCG